MKRSINFTNEMLEELKELISILGIEGYGDIPKAIKFGVTFTLQELKRTAKVTPDLNNEDLDIYFSSIKKLSTIQNTEK